MRIRTTAPLVTALTLSLWAGAAPAQAGKPAPKSFSVTPATQNVGESAGTAALTVTRTAKGGSASVHLVTSSGTAVAGHDFTAVNTTVSFPSGSTSQVVTVPILNNFLSETTESFTVALNTPSRGYVVSLAAGSATISIDDNDAPAAPTSPSATTTAPGTIDVGWDTASDYVDHWTVGRATVSGGPYTSLGSVSTNSLQDTGLTGGTTYYYVITAVNGLLSTASAEVSETAGTQVLAPSNVVATANGSHAMDITWDAPSDDANLWLVERSTTAGGPYTSLDHPTTNSYADINLSPNTTYYYVVSALNDVSSASADEISGTTAVLPVPTLPDDVETDFSQWVTTGLWHLIDNSSCAPGYFSATHAFYYANPLGCNYQTSINANSGDLTSPDYTGVTGATELTVHYRLGTEPVSPSPASGCVHGFDVSVVEVSYDGGTNWTTVDVCLPDSSSAWTSITYPINPTGDTLRVRFHFETNDGQFNGYLGWMIDDLSVDNGI